MTDEERDFDLLAQCAVKLGFSENGHKAINGLYKRYPVLKKEPNYLAWCLNRLNHRIHSEIEPVESPWAFIQDMMKNRPAVPSITEGGDDNYFRAEKTVEEYCNPILGIVGQKPTPVRGGDFMPFGKINNG
jgi:hypothetical protein